MGWYNKINRSHIDFVLCDPQTMQPLIAVGLAKLRRRVASSHSA